MTATRRAWLIAEMMLLFIGAPLAAYVLVHTYGTPLFLVFLPMALIFITALTIDGRFIWWKVLTTGVNWSHAGGILAAFVLFGSAIALYAWQVEGRFLYFPRFLPGIWLLVMVVYPLVSVTAQEIMYRVFFFHRYGEVFGHNPWPLILLNGVLFAFAHILFDNWISIWMSLVGGILFAWRYVRTGSFWAVTLEHALYGNLIFTVGMGRYFFTGVSNFG